jgi:hypothetical protein
LIIRYLIAPLTVVVSLHAIHAVAQSAFPAPLPGQDGAAATAPASPIPVPPFGGLPPPDSCMKGFAPLREDAERRGKTLKAASERKAGPGEVCKLLIEYRQAEIRLMQYVDTNAARCRIPAQLVDQIKTGHKATEQLQQKICSVAPQAARTGQGVSDKPGLPRSERLLVGDFWTTRQMDDIGAHFR